MEKSTSYLKYFEPLEDKNQLYEAARRFHPDIPDVLAYQEGSKLFFAQKKTSRHNTATSEQEIMQVLDHLELKERLITINAFNITKEVSKKIRNEGGDYVIAVKGKHQNLHIDAVEYFKEILSARTEEFRYDSTKTMQRPRGEKTELRICYASTDVSWLHYRRDWADMRSLSMILRLTRENGMRLRKASYYVSSLDESPEHFMPAARRYWGEQEIIWWMCVEKMPNSGL